MSNCPTRWLAPALLSTCLLAGCTLPAAPGLVQANEMIAEQPVNVSDQGAPMLLPTVTPEPDRSGGPTAAQQVLLAKLPSSGPAPELTNAVWFNSAPLRLADLRGKVVMVEFWTFGCINCQHVLPYVQEWYATYKEEGFEIIGVHTPEFAYEKELGNVEAAIGRLGVTWPVAIDNDWVTWQAYANHYWPAAYFVDKQGNIRQLLIGEGHYDYAEQVIQALLAEPG